MCLHKVEDCPDDCDGVANSWKPEVGKIFHGHGPGQTFASDGTGGGTLSWEKQVYRPGFRTPRVVIVTLRKEAHHGN